jgi:hypothetical protein
MYNIASYFQQEYSAVFQQEYNAAFQQAGNKVLPKSGPPSPVVEEIVWESITNLKLIWTGQGDKMIQFRTPVRNKTPQYIQYIFLDVNQTPIDLSTYISCFMEMKLQGVVYGAVQANFISAAAGLVAMPSYSFSGVGVWDIQFNAEDPAGNRIFGDVLQITVVPNVEDLTIEQLAQY